MSDRKPDDSKPFKVNAGDVLIFKGVIWNDGWEFDAPMIIYSPVCDYSEDGSIVESAIESRVEEICMDLCDPEDERFTPSSIWGPADLKDFEWRGWSTKGFKRRKGVHAHFEVRFFTDPDPDAPTPLAFEMKQIPIPESKPKGKQ